jgi:hypothetical protein
MLYVYVRIKSVRSLRDIDIVHYENESIHAKAAEMDKVRDDMSLKYMGGERRRTKDVDDAMWIMLQ